MGNEKSNNTKEKMLKSCKKLNKVINVFTWGIVGVVLAYLIFLTILSIIMIVSPDAEFKVQVGNYVAEIIRFAESDRITQKIDEFNEVKNSSTLVDTVEFIMVWSILGSISGILKTTVDNETPFTEKNIKYMKKISIYATILWILTTPFIINAGLIFILAIWIMSYIFKYGYELQIESDEIL